MGKVRIIGGKWRSRQIVFPSIEGLRPTQDRVRETLFNWLSPYIQGAVCMDLFAGTGALGFEAVSRGASKAILIETQDDLLQSLHQNLVALDAKNVDVIKGTCPHSMPQFYPYLVDVVFIDPPFYKELVASAIEWLETHHALKQNALIYIECEKELSPLPIPQHWEIFKESKTAYVNFYLCRLKPSE